MMQVERELDEEEEGGRVQADAAQGGAAASDSLAFMQEVDAHQAMLQENIRRAELLAQRMHDDCAGRRREARQRAKDALMQAATAAAAAASSKIDDLKRELAGKLARKVAWRSLQASGGGDEAEGAQDGGGGGGRCVVADD
jgi:hypothetical protein